MYGLISAQGGALIACAKRLGDSSQLRVNPIFMEFPYKIFPVGTLKGISGGFIMLCATKAIMSKRTKLSASSKVTC
jgi:hypothetical protein